MGGATIRKGTGTVAVAFGLAAIALVSASPASAANRFAEVGGNGPAASCPQLDPCSIENAINAASSATNDDVTLLGGLPPSPYVPTAVLNVPSNVTVHGAPGARPVINTSFSPGVALAPGSVLRDVVVNYSGTNDSAVQAIGGGLIERVTGRATAASGSSDGGCSTAGSGTITIRDSICSQEVTDSANGGGINARNDAPGLQTLVLRNVTAISLTDNRPGLSAITSGGGTMTVTATNVIAQTGQEASADDVGVFVNGATINLDHSNYDSETDIGAPPGMITNPGTGAPNFNQTTPPVFIDVAAGDFRQATGSTGTIDLGTATGVLPGELDFEGQNRTIGAAPDIGADEFPPPPAAPTGLGTTPASGSNDNSPFLFGSAAAGTTVEAFLTANCSGAPFDTGPATEFQSPGFQVTPPVADNSVTQLSARATNAGGAGPCSAAISYAEVTPAPISPLPGLTAPVETGERAAALKRCKQKAKKKDWSKKRLKKCRRKALQLPL
jgi:hypothetical protein